MATESDDLSGFIWTPRPDEPLSMERDLTNTERMFVILNRDLYGQNCPFIGASIYIQDISPSIHSGMLGSADFRKKAVEAFCQTRWRYPTVAARVSVEGKAIYDIDEEAKVRIWAERTVTAVVDGGGWLALREKISRDVPIPSPNGDYCVVYLITKPEESARGNITSFDILMHIHHAFTDGSGIRSILNEFISRLANPLPSDQIQWGKEVDRLLPPLALLLKPEQIVLDITSMDAKPAASSGFFAKSQADVGLPLYRPEIGPPGPQYRGAELVSHTFEPEILRTLLATGREHGVKLAAILHAALLKAVHETTDTVLGPEDYYKSRSALDLRNGWMLPPYSEKGQYVNSAFVVHPIEVPCHLFSQENGFWEAAAYITKLWEVAKKKKGMVATMESEAAAFIESRKKQSSTPLPTKPRTCPYFVSDPPGSHLLDSIFPVSGHENLQFVLESYQLATDQSQAIVSARSHTFHDKLTLCLVFNAARNPKEKMQEFLETWMRVLEMVYKNGELDGIS